ncbi:MAG TPA: histidine kinase [Casimicrobiaceae bacterium]|nr:histidine kinase [Casimicrobiaceae bacterium]
MPDLRNLGTILRILLAVNGATLLIAYAREPRFPALATEWATLTGFVEPQLFAELAVLWLVQPLLAKAGDRYAIAIVTLVTCAIALGIDALFPAMIIGARGTPIRHLVFALIAQFVLIGYFRLRARALSPAITEARLQALQARIRPHFLFNSLTAVLSLMRSEPRRAEVALEDLADLFRVLMRDNRELAPLADEVELCRQYLELEQLRLGDRLVIDWNVKSMPAEALVPPLVLQPLLENAVYHGIEPSPTPGVLSINIFLSRDEVHAILRNPYVATSARHHAGNRMALDNIRERLALHFDAEARLDSRVNRDVYEVHIRMPYRTAKASAVGSHSSDASRRERRGEPGAEKRREPRLTERLPSLSQARVDHA